MFFFFSCHSIQKAENKFRTEVVRIDIERVKSIYNASHWNLKFDQRGRNNVLLWITSVNGMAQQAKREMLYELFFQTSQTTDRNCRREKNHNSIFRFAMKATSSFHGIENIFEWKIKSAAETSELEYYLNLNIRERERKKIFSIDGKKMMHSIFHYVRPH